MTEQWESLHDGVWQPCECLNDTRRRDSGFPHRVKPEPDNPILDEDFVTEWFSMKNEIAALRAERDVFREAMQELEEFMTPDDLAKFNRRRLAKREA